MDIIIEKQGNNEIISKGLFGFNYVLDFYDTGNCFTLVNKLREKYNVHFGCFKKEFAAKVNFKDYKTGEEYSYFENAETIQEALVKITISIIKERGYW